MKKKLDILKWLLPLVVLLATACGHDDLLPPDEYVEEVTPYVELRIAVPLANPYGTRANPMGGEEGNGREHGVLNEDKIHNINVFFYIEGVDEKGKGLGMDSPDDTKIIRHIYYNLDSSSDTQNTPEVTLKPDVDNNPPDYWDKNYIILRFECTQADIDQITASGGINFVAVANTGKLQFTEGKTLGWLRNLELYEDTPTWQIWRDAFSKNATEMDNFLMSTAYNNDSRCGTNKIVPSTTGNVTTYSGTSTLQRMYARLDLWYNNSADVAKNNVVKDGENIKELKYQIVDKDNANVANTFVYLTNVLPVNVMLTPSFIFKKVTNTNESWSTTNPIWDKANLASVSEFSWGGKESPSEGPFTGTSYKDLPTNYVMERHTNSKLVGGGSSTESLTLWYGNTRTAEVKNKIANTANGNLSSYYSGSPASETTINYDCNYISIISYANENTHPTDCFHSDYLTGMAFRGVYIPANIYKSYDENEDDGETTTGLTPMTDDDVTGLSISSGTNGTKIYRYSPTAGKSQTQLEKESKYFIDRDVAEDYAKAHPGEMGIITAYNAIKHNVKAAEGTDVTKLGFVCYYNLWLRHYNDENDAKSDPHPHLPMEYATVRNHLSRVELDFRGPGYPEPTMREPDTMKARIFVRKWNYKEEPTINFEL